MASFTTPRESIWTAPRAPRLTWGTLCAALEAGQIPATLEDDTYVVRVADLRRLQPQRPTAIPRSSGAAKASRPWRRARLSASLPTRQLAAEQPLH